MDPKNYWPSPGQQAEAVSSGRSRRLRLTVSALAGGIFLVVMIGLLFATTIMASPAVEIAITPDTQSVKPGGVADLTITITNSGSITLTHLTVDSIGMSGCSRWYYDPPYQFLNLPDLGPGEITSYDCSVVEQYESTQGSATVSAVPEGSTETVRATGFASFIVNHLLVVIPELIQIGSGQPADIQVTISNTGDFVVSNIAVTDTVNTSCSRSPGTLTDLNPGQAHNYTCQLTPLFLDREVQLNATAKLSDSTPLVDQAVYVVDVLTPLEITLSPERQVILPGYLGSFSVLVRNSGAATLTKVAVEALTAPTCARSAGTLADLAPGGSHTYSCVSLPLEADTTTQLTASAQEGAVTVKATASAFVDANPPVTIEVSPEIQFVEPGITATFMVTLTNKFTNISLVDITVDAPETPGCVKNSGDVPDLAPGASHSYTCEALIVDKRFVHPLTVFGSPYDGDPVTDQAIVYAGRRHLYFPLSFRSAAPDEGGITPP